MFTKQFKVTLGVVMLLCVLVILGFNQALLAQKIKHLEQSAALSQKPVYVAMPSATPTASPTAMLKQLVPAATKSAVPVVKPSVTVK